MRVIGALKQIPLPEIPHGEEGLIESVWLLLTSVVVVPLVCKLPGGSPVLGFLVSAGPLLSPFLCASSPCSKFEHAAAAEYVLCAPALLLCDSPVTAKPSVIEALLSTSGKTLLRAPIAHGAMSYT